jgi:hypothetical protein
MHPLFAVSFALNPSPKRILATIAATLQPSVFFKTNKSSLKAGEQVLKRLFIPRKFLFLLNFKKLKIKDQKLNEITYCLFPLRIPIIFSYYLFTNYS